ncbi:MAG: mechanosensitive ion channel domain-containing protein [Halieaceae bacterium]|nr:mechanosensitive ion channel domain-containing protein [Halieaceae bacterium]
MYQRLLRLAALVVASFFAASIFAASMVAAQSADSTLPSPAELEAARESARESADLTEEGRTRLLDTYGRIAAQLKVIEEQRAQAATYRKALESAGDEARKMRDQLEEDINEAEDSEVSVPAGLSIEEAERQVQADKTALKTMEDQAQRLAKQSAAGSESVESLRAKIAETQQLLDELGSSSLASEGLGAASLRAQTWLQAAQTEALEATKDRLEAELLSRPVREELNRVKQDRLAFDISVITRRLQAYEAAALALRQEQAQRALSEVASTQEAVADAHPAIRTLAGENTVLSAEITARTSALEDLKENEQLATEQAVRFEKDLESIKRKLDVLGMSEALGRILREQQARLPKPLYSRADVAERDRLISDASLNQLRLEDERRSLQSLGNYVDALLADVPPEQAALIRPDLIDLARTRRDLVRTALDVETRYLRALGDLDFAIRRVETAANSYRDFISERLLWIRSSQAFSIDTLKMLPGELLAVVSPAAWWNVVEALPGALLGSVLFPVLLLVVAVLLRYRGLMLRRLIDTSAVVGQVDRDTFSATAQGMVYTLLLAAAWPLLAVTLGAALEVVNFDGRLERSVGLALKRLTGYFYGLEVLRHLMIKQGLVRSHFSWPEHVADRLQKKVLQLEAVFIPAVFVAIIANRTQAQEGQSILASVALMVALLALSRFFMQTPSLAQGQLARLIKVQGSVRQGLLGRLLRYFLTLLPLVLVVCILLGYTHTAIEFLASMVGTLALFVGLLLLHEFGVRWLRLMRLRLIERERQAAIQAAQAASEGEGEPDPEVDFESADPDELDSEGRNLLNTTLLVLAVTGTWGVWSDVLPALGILDAVELWSTTRLVDGVETRSPVTPLDIVKVLLVTFAGFVLTQRLPSLLDLFLRQKVELAAGTVYATVTLIRYVLIAVFVVVVMGMLGADWSQIQWAVAALSVGIGFGLQEIVANFISGIILLFEQPIRVGDIITVGETSGSVTKIRMRATTVRDWDGKELLVPNKEFITGRLLNWSLSDQQTRLVVEIGVAYGSDVPRAMQIALDAAKAHPDVLADPEPFITFDAFGDNSLALTLRCYLPSLDRRLFVGSELRNAINDQYNAAGIVIAFPQRDVHLNTLSPLEVTILNAESPRGTEGESA